jgi:hypothetical protein
LVRARYDDLFPDSLDLSHAARALSATTLILPFTTHPITVATS